MSSLRPDNIKVPGIFIPSAHPETGEAIELEQIQAYLGEMGIFSYMVDPTPPAPQTLLPYDPENHGPLGVASFEELRAFTESQGREPALASRIWREWTAESRDRHVNNRLYREGSSLWEQRTDLQEIYRTKLNEATRSYQETAVQHHTPYNTKAIMQDQERIDREFAEAYGPIEQKLAVLCRDVLGPDATPASAAAKFEKLVDPEERGEPFIFAEIDPENRRPLMSHTLTETFAGSCADMSLVYGHVQKKAEEMAALGKVGQVIPQVQIGFVNEFVREATREE
jgi:hypothetical protein